MARDRAKDAKSKEDEPDDLRYAAAVEEIERILQSIDRDEIDVDELSQKVERAVALLKICRAKLKATELRVTQVLDDLAAEGTAEEARDEANSDAESEVRPTDSSESDVEPKPTRSRRKKESADDDDLDLPF